MVLVWISLINNAEHLFMWLTGQLYAFFFFPAHFSIMLFGFCYRVVWELDIFEIILLLAIICKYLLHTFVVQQLFSLMCPIFVFFWLLPLKSEPNKIPLRLLPGSLLPVFLQDFHGLRFYDFLHEVFTLVHFEFIYGVTQ